MNLRRAGVTMIFLLAAIAATGAGSDVQARVKVRAGRGPARPAHITRVSDYVNDRRIDVNTLNMYVSNYGAWGYDQIHSNASGGLLFPIHTPKTVLYAGGLWMGCTVHDTVRIAASVYGSEFQPGPYGGIGTDTDAPQHIAYKVVPFTGSAADTDHVERTPAELAGDPTLDDLLHHSWSEYLRGAAPYGAPTRTYRFGPGPGQTDSVDVLGPDFPGGSSGTPASQMIWSVFNDANPDLHGEFSTNPLGVEIQQRVFAFNRTGALGQTLFIWNHIINQGPDTLQNMYVALWADPDLGGFTDDLVGCDTVLSLGFCYNSTNADGVYGTAPPAIGYDFFLGPRDTTGRVLPLTSFNKYINGTDPGTADEAYNYMQGLLPDGSALTDPTTSLETKFFHPGDPVTGTGWLDTSPADRRFLMNSGPFKMLPGESQDVVGAIIVAQGSDRLSSITGLKFFDRSAQAAFDSSFKLCPAPPQPVVSVDAQHGQVRLCWDARSQTNYINACPGYAFEGYNIYQGSSVAGPWKLLAVYDVQNGIKVVRDTVFDVNIGQQIADFPVAFGGDNGLQYCYATSVDAIRGGELKDASDYFFAVTAYAVNPSVGGPEHPKVLENPIAAIKVTPQRPATGTDLNVASADCEIPIQASSAAPPTTDQVVVTVTNPAAITGHTYEVTYNPSGTWNLIDINTGATLLSNITEKTTTPSYGTVDGMLVALLGAPVGGVPDSNGFNAAYYCPARDIPPLEGVPGAGMESFNGGAGVAINFTGVPLDPTADADSFVTVELRFSDTATQKAYRYLRYEKIDGSRPPGGRRNLYAGFKTVPFTAWDVQHNVQLDAAFYERIIADDNGVPLRTQPSVVDSTWGPSSSADGGKEWLFIANTPYTDTPKAAYEANLAALDGTIPELYFLWARGLAPRVNGDMMRFVWGLVPGTPNDTLKFATHPLVRGNVALAKSAGLGNVRVVPNPYYNRSRYELSQFNRVVRFINLPETATIRIYNLGGDLVRTLHKTDPTTSILQWNLLTDRNLPIGSGVYVYHVDSPGVGDNVGRIVVFMEKERLNNF